MGKAGYGGLRRNIILSTLGFSLIPLFALGLTIYSLFYASYESKVREELEFMLESKRSAMEAFFQEQVARLKLLSSLVDYNRVQDHAYLRDVFHRIQGLPHSFVDLSVINSDGDQLAYVGPYDLRDVNYARAEWFQATMSRGNHISDVFPGYRNIPHVVVALVAREGDRKWVLRATMDSDILNAIVREAGKGRAGDAFIINKKAVFQTKPLRGGDMGEVSGYVELTRSPSGTHVGQAGIDADKMMAATTWVKDNEWLLVVRRNLEKELEPVFRARFVAAVLFSVGILIIVLGTILTTRLTMARLVRTDREKALLDDALIHSDKMAALGKLAAGMAHEVNNPLSVIKEKAGWMKDIMQGKGVDRQEDMEGFQAAVDKIDFHVERARKVTHRLLGFARGVEPLRETVSVHDLIDQTIEFLSSEALYRNIKLTRDYLDDLPAVQTDSGQLQQVFLNLLDNAVDAVEKDGEITIKTRYDPEKGETFIAFTDTGGGIPARNLQKIFDPFFTTKRAGQGTGLGLSISHGIVEKLGGRITVESQEGNGSTFTVVIPVETSK